MRIYFDLKRKVQNPIFTVSIYSPEGLSISSSHSHTDGYKFDDLQGQRYVEYCLHKIAFRPAKYFCSIVLSENEISNILDWHEKKYTFTLKGNITNDGLMNPFPEWKLK
jgi:hypothetical protein